jgi:hypothetical protein
MVARFTRRFSGVPDIRKRFVSGDPRPRLVASA